MKFNNKTCIDAGTEFCPCHLAESGDCILCSQLKGEKFCDCSNWSGTCIYNEFINNNYKAKASRNEYTLNIKKIEFLEDTLVRLTVNSPHKLIMSLINPGSFVFIKGSLINNYFDFPISIEHLDIENNFFTMCIEIRGSKTKNILQLKEGGNLNIRGPYFNGVFGLDNLKKLQKSNVLIIARGIGGAPSQPVIKKLQENGNKLLIVYDSNPFQTDYFFEKTYNIEIEYMNIFDKGKLTTKFKNYFLDKLKTDIKLIHCAGADILTTEIINFLHELDLDELLLSCCNNSKMCCGEGICGSCTARYKGQIVKRLCKIQEDPRSIFKERRFI
ncbi:MAG: sulfide/dihydroorotate dehydrogenase-like FAD/NAD-binding protein [Sarcina sp.]